MDYVKNLSGRFYPSHRYLAQHPPTHQFSPASTERIINKILESSTSDIILPKPVAVIIAKSEPHIWAPWTDITRAKLAFGDLCLPKLRRDLSSKHTMIICQALCSLSDLSHNPEIACQTLSLNLHSRFVKLLKSENPFIRHRTLLCIKVLATQPFGNVIMAQNNILLTNIIDCLQDQSYLIKNQAILAVNAFLINPFARDKFVEKLFLKNIIECLIQYKEDEINEFYIESYMVILIQCIQFLIQDNDDAKIQSMAYNVFMLTDLLKHKNREIVNSTAEVMCELFKHVIGKLASYHWPFIEYLSSALIDNKPRHCRGILSTLRFATLATESRKQALSVGLIDNLVEMVRSTKEPQILINITQILTNLAEHPDGRKRLQEIGPALMFRYKGLEPNLQRNILDLLNTIHKPF